MKALLGFLLFTMMSSAFAVTWSYQVNVNNNQGQVRRMDANRTTFEAADHYCEVTPVAVNNTTEFRTLICGVGASVVSTGGLCTQKAAKVASVQYAILNINTPKRQVNIVVSCKFD